MAQRDQVRYAWATTRAPPEAFEEPERTPDRHRCPSSRGAAGERLGAWVLLNNAFYKSRLVSERNDRTVEIRIPPANTEEDASLRSLRTDSSRRGEPIYYAFKNDGFIARIVSVELRSEDGKSAWAVALKPDRDLRANATLEIGSYNGVSADEIAARRARLILLNESPLSHGHSNERLDAMLSSVNSDIKVTEGIFPKLWVSFKGRPQLFLPAARLWAVFMLKASGTCEEILDLRLGPITAMSLEVQFRGRRRRQYVNADPVVLEIQGTCNLNG